MITMSTTPGLTGTWRASPKIRLMTGFFTSRERSSTEFARLLWGGTCRFIGIPSSSHTGRAPTPHSVPSAVIRRDSKASCFHRSVLFVYTYSLCSCNVAACQWLWIGVGLIWLVAVPIQPGAAVELRSFDPSRTAKLALTGERLELCLMHPSRHAAARWFT